VTDRKVNIVTSLAGFGYGLLYLYLIGDIDFADTGWQWQRVPLTVERLLSQRSPLYFEAIAKLEACAAVILLSPLNILIAFVLSLLLALNIHGALDLSNRRECRVSTGGMLAGALPALLAGGACCAPALLLLIGVPAVGAFVGLFPWLMPLSFVLLFFGRWWQQHLGARRILYWL